MRDPPWDNFPCCWFLSPGLGLSDKHSCELTSQWTKHRVFVYVLPYAAIQAGLIMDISSSFGMLWFARHSSGDRSVALVYVELCNRSCACFATHPPFFHAPALFAIPTELNLPFPAQRNVWRKRHVIVVSFNYHRHSPAFGQDTCMTVSCLPSI